jgi:hypothetical protein
MNHTDYINFTPVPRICSGRVTSKIKDTETWEVSIYESPLGKFNGPIYCQMIYQPGFDYNIKQGSYVKVLITFMFGGTNNRYTDIAPGGANYILGVFNEQYMIPGRVENPNSDYSDDSIRFINKKNGAGIVATDNGQTILSSGGTISHVLKPFGYGVDKNSSRCVAQNHQRVVAYNPPFYLSKEYFGMFSGSDQNDEASKISEKDFYINYRRFVQESRDVENWVSTCEGYYAPWVGANNNATSIGKSKNSIFNKIINQGSLRLTVECGESKEDFFTMRIDDVKVSEKSITTDPGATPAKLGNRMKITVGGDGSVDIDAAGAGLPGSNTHGVKISISAGGDLSIYSKGKMTFSHGPDDVDKNSIVLDPKNGIDLQAVNGVRVNGQEVVLSSLTDWMDKNQGKLCQVTSIGGPAPIHPTALPDFIQGIKVFGENGGFTSKGKGAPASGIIKGEDNFNSV